MAVGAIMDSAVEESVLSAGGNSVAMSHLEDIYFATARPGIDADIITHHPESGPKAIGSARESDVRHYHPVGESLLAAGVDTPRGEGLILILSTACSK